MRTEIIESFLGVYETGSFTAAAKRLYTEQPVVTKHITQLEKELGRQLFVRTTRQVSATPAGEAFYEKASEAMLLLDQAIAKVKMLESEKQAELRIGYHYLYMDSLTTAWSREFEQSNQDAASIVYSETTLRALIQQVSEGQINACFVGVTDEDLVPPHLGKLLVMSMDEVILVGKTHRLANYSSVALKDLLGERIVYPMQPPDADNSIVLKDFQAANREAHTSNTSFESSALLLVERGDAIIDLPSESPIPSSNVISIPYRSKNRIYYYFVWNLANESALFKDYVAFITRKVSQSQMPLT